MRAVRFLRRRYDPSWGCKSITVRVSVNGMEIHLVPGARVAIVVGAWPCDSCLVAGDGKVKLASLLPTNVGEMCRGCRTASPAVSWKRNCCAEGNLVGVRSIGAFQGMYRVCIWRHAKVAPVMPSPRG